MDKSLLELPTSTQIDGEQVGPGPDSVHVLSDYWVAAGKEMIDKLVQDTKYYMNEYHGA